MGTEEDKLKDPPRVQLELQADGLRIRWGPQKGRWGVFKEDADPVEVEIKEWHLYVSEKPPGYGAKSKGIISKTVGTKTEIIIPRDDLHQHKVVIAQVLGGFKSKDLEGEEFMEGIYSEPESLEINWSSQHPEK
jgi:hypothetical protein